MVPKIKMCIYFFLNKYNKNVKPQKFKNPQYSLIVLVW